MVVLGGGLAVIRMTKGQSDSDDDDPGDYRDQTSIERPVNDYCDMQLLA
jgi:hypothetical protein